MSLCNTWFNNNSIGFSDLEEQERNDRFDYESEEDKNMVR